MFDDYEDDLEQNEDLLMRKQIGLLGLQMMNLTESITDMDESFTNRPDVYQSFGRDNRSYDEDDFEPLVDEIDGYREDVRGFYSKISEIDVDTNTRMSDGDDEGMFSPLIATLNRHKIENDSREVMKRRTFDLHMGNILAALADKDKDSSSQLLVTLRRWYNDFLWNFSRAAVGLLASTAKSAFSAVNQTLFGSTGMLGFIGFGKDTTTEQQRTTKAIKQQTEFFMTGKIDQSVGFVEKLKKFGLIGTTVRGAGNLALRGMGLTKDLAQENAIRKAKGEDLGKRNIRSKLDDWFVDKVYGDVTTKYGNVNRNDPLGSNAVDDVTANPSQDRSLIEALYIGVDKIDHTLQIGFEKSTSFHDFMSGALETQLNATTGVHEVSVNRDEIDRLANDRATRSTDSIAEAVINTSRRSELTSERESAIERIRYDAMTDTQETTNASLVDIAEYTQMTAIETRKHRRQAFFRRVLDGVKGIIGGIAALGASLLGAIAGIFKFLRGGKAAAATATTGAAALKAAGKTSLMGKLKTAVAATVATVGAVSAALGRKGIASGLSKLANFGKAASATIEKKGVKGTVTSIVEAAKAIDKNTIKTAASATVAATISTTKKAKDVAGDTLKTRATAKAAKKAEDLAAATKLAKETAAANNAAKAAQEALDLANPAKAKSKKLGGVKTIGAIGGYLALDAATTYTDKDTKTGGAARAAASTADGYFTGSIIGGALGALIGGVGGALGGAGVGAIPGAAAGWATGTKLGGAAGAGIGAATGLYQNKDALSGKAMRERMIAEEKTKEDKNSGVKASDIVSGTAGAGIGAATGLYQNKDALSGKAMRERMIAEEKTKEDKNSGVKASDIVSGTVPVGLGEINTGAIKSTQQNDGDIDLRSSTASATANEIDGSSKIKNAASRNELWAKPTMDEPSEIKTTLTAIQESISMPLDYIKNTYDELAKVTGETVDKLTEGNEISKTMAKTMKEMADKMSSGGGSPFSSMGDPSVGAF